MKYKFSFTILTFALIFWVTNTKAQEHEESTPVSIDDIKGKVDGMEENVKELITDVSGLKKIKISGYLQVQFEKSEAFKGIGMSPYDSTDFVQGRFRIRRSRVKFGYDAGMTQFVVQGDFSNEKFELKDAYLNFTDPWTKYVSMTVGVFNRPVYEVEYSSSQRESMERSKVIRTLYPSERDLGFMFTIVPEDWFKLQLAGFNNTYNGDLSQFWPNSNKAPLYYMARLTKEFAFTDLGLGIDLGVHARMGNMVANTDKAIESDMPGSASSSTTSINKGDDISRNWFGFEAQIYWDFLGGMKILGEYIMGSNADQPTTAAQKPLTTSIRKRDFSGFYAMLVKNISDEWQFAVKYDAYNPNTKISADKIDNTADLAVSTLGFGIHNYSFSNVRISLWYDMNKTTTNDNVVKGKALLANDPVDNFMTLRFQYKF
ncbi:MAG: hypothetical protein HW421_498 [Ignavibacteria bacterium]|nr:hypothetical protein [Ignavibacteria bacterium]